MKSNLERAQDFALDQWLFDYPKDMSYLDIVKIMEQDTWDSPNSGWRKIITPKIWIEDHIGVLIADLIANTVLDVEVLLD